MANITIRKKATRLIQLCLIKNCLCHHCHFLLSFDLVISDQLHPSCKRAYCFFDWISYACMFACMSCYIVSIAVKFFAVVVISCQGNSLSLWFSCLEQWRKQDSCFYNYVFFFSLCVPIRFSLSSHHSRESNECNPVFVHEGASKQERAMTIESEKGSEKKGRRRRRRRETGKQRMKTVIYTKTYIYI